MSDRPLVSVIIATYNCGRFVSQAVESALGQTYSPLEVIVVDDGSTDDTAEVLSEFGGAVRVIRQANAGISAARNAGIREARGEFMAVLDADDVWMPEKLQMQMSLFRAEPRLDLVSARARVIDEAGRELRAVYPKRWPEGLELHPVMNDGYVLEGDWPFYLARTNFLVHGSVVARLSAVRAVGGYDEELRSSVDYCLYWRLIGTGCRFGLLDLVVCTYRRHTGAVTWDRTLHGQRRKVALQKLLDGPFPLPRTARRELRCALARIPKNAADKAFCRGERPEARRLYLEAFGYLPRPAQIASWAATFLGPMALRVLKLINSGSDAFDEFLPPPSETTGGR